jgi:flagellum-specific ATP synthase
MQELLQLKQNLDKVDFHIPSLHAKVTGIQKSIVESKGIAKYVEISKYAYIVLDSGKHVICEVVGLKDDIAFFLPLEDYAGAKIGNKIILSDLANFILPDHTWRGRILDAFANPQDNLGPLTYGKDKYFLYADALSFEKRQNIGEKISLGVKAIDVFVPCCVGQRLGIFGGSGVGKSILTAMLTKYAKADVKIVGFIGERSREINEFINNLSQHDKQNTIIVGSSSAQSPLIKKRAAYLTISIAEYFRDQGLEVLCMMDSVTRLAMAQREISLTAGEMPVSRGYTASVFSLLPKLLERAGPGPNGKGNITGLFSVLVDGDDFNEPISDCIRSILDGHIMLDRDIAERNLFPAVNVLKSISRTAPNCYHPLEYKIMQKAKNVIKTYEDMKDIISLGIYKKGTDVALDEAIDLYSKIQVFLNQQLHEASTQEESFQELAKILNFA